MSTPCSHDTQSYVALHGIIGVPYMNDIFRLARTNASTIDNVYVVQGS